MSRLTDPCSAEPPRGEIDRFIIQLADQIQVVEMDLHRVEERFGRVLFSPPKPENGAVKSDPAQSALGEQLREFVRNLERIDIRLKDLVVNCQL